MLRSCKGKRSLFGGCHGKEGPVTSAMQKAEESQPWASVGVEIDASDWVSINQE